MDRRTFLRAAAVGGTASLAGCPVGGDSDGGADGPPRLSVDGRWLTDPDGNRVVLRGVNVVDPWWGVIHADLRGKDYWETIEQATDPDQGWHAHVIRVPVQPRTIDEIGYDALVSDYLDRVVEVTREQGVYALIDYHAIARYDTVDIDRRVRDFWDAVAGRYADETHVLYELFNEPTQPGGDRLASWRNWRSVAEPWVAHVRERAPETPIVVGSPQWSSMTRFATVAPFSDDNVVYSGHVFPSWAPSDWEANFGSPALDVPVFLTEWGYVNVRDDRTDPHMIGSTSGWGEPFRRWLGRHDNVSWAAWTFDSEWMPPMFDHDWQLLGGDDYMGQFTKRWLAEKRTEDWPFADEGETLTPPGPGEPPGAPPSLSVTERTPSTITLAWEAAPDPDGVVVQYRVAVDGRTSQTLRPSELTARLAGLDPDTEYAITVTAVDDRGNASEPARTTASTLAATEPVATIPRASAAPTIDGTLDDAWGDAATHAIEHVLVPPPEGMDGASATWRALWDETAIYYLVSVTDPDDHADSDAVYQDDSVEVYFDPDHSRGSRYDGENDAQLIVRRGESMIRPGANSVAYPNATAASAETDDGYRVEFAIPWSDAGVDPEAGLTFGTDVHVNDDEDGGDRDAKIGWFDTVDSAWERPDAFATVALGE